MAMYWVYILRCADDTLYTGITTDPARRAAVHNSGKGAKYTRSRLPVQIVYCKACGEKADALRCEWKIKQMPRQKKLELISRSGEPGTS